MAKIILIALSCAFTTQLAYADDEQLCDRLFSKLVANEPALANEMTDLKQLCTLDFAQSGPAYWQCIDSYMEDRGYTSDNLILSGHLCVNVDQLSSVEVMK